MAIAAVGVATLIANLILQPSTLRQGNRVPLREQVKLVTNGRLLLAFIITALGYGGTFVVFTYLSPLLHDITGFKQKTVTFILLLYGIAIAIGNVIGGKAANRKPLSALFYMFLIQALVLFLLLFTVPFKAAGLITKFFLWDCLHL